MKKKLVILSIMSLLVLVLAASFTVALANQSQNESTIGSLNVTSNPIQTEKGILSTLEKDIEFTQSNELLADEDKIRAIVTDLFLAMNNCEKEGIAFEFPSIFGRGSNNAKKSYEYRANKIKFVNELRRRDNTRILWNNVYVDFKDININGSDATVKLVENKKYIAGKQDNGISESQLTYTVKLVKAEGKWLVNGIVGGDEFDKDYQDRGLTAEQMLADYDKPAVKVETITSRPKPSKDKVSALLWTASYDRSRASNYALTYALSNNANFFKYSSNCQNFGSQGVWYGFGGTNTSTAIRNRHKPMVTEPANDAEKWWNTGLEWGFDPRGHWVRVIAFRDHIADWAKTYGVFGSITTGSVKDTEVGDIIQKRNKDTKVWDHTYIVDAVDGTKGSRTPSNIWVCAHTADIKHQQLSTRGVAESDMRLIKINSAQGPQ